MLRQNSTFVSKSFLSSTQTLSSSVTQVLCHLMTSGETNSPLPIWRLPRVGFQISFNVVNMQRCVSDIMPQNK